MIIIGKFLFFVLLVSNFCDQNVDGASTTAAAAAAAAAVTATTTSSNVFKCNPGSFLNTTTARGAICEPCSPGSFSSTTNATSCTLCGPSQYQSSSGATACVDCPSPGSQWTSIYGSKSSEDCTCRAGYYSPQVLQTPIPKGPLICIECPTGAICRGEEQIPRPKAGYWAANGSLDFFPCDWSTEACVGATATSVRAFQNNNYDPLCATGHIGFMCSECIIREYYMLGGRCSACDAKAKALIGILAAIALFGGLIFLYLYRIEATTTLSACVQYFQVLTVINRMGGNWPREMQIALQGVATLNFSPEVLQLNCEKDEVDRSPFASYLMMMMIPACFVGLCFLAALAATAYCFQRHLPPTVLLSFITKLRIGAMMFMTLLYMPFTIRTLEVLNCVTKNGRTYMPTDPSVTCYDAEYNRTYLPVAIASIIFFIIGVPAIFAYTFYHCRDGVELGVYSQSYGIFWRNYKPEYFWWSMVLLMRKLGIALSVALLRSDPFFQAIGSIVVWLGCMSYHFYSRPYKFKTLDRLDDVLFILMLGIFLVCLLFRSEENPTAVSTLTFQVFVLIASIVAFVCLSAFVVVEIRVGTIKTKVKTAANTLKRQPTDEILNDQTMLLTFTRFLVKEHVLPQSAESWLVYKAEDEQKFLLQKFYQSLSETMTKDSDESNEPTSFQHITFAYNTSAQILRFLIECSEHDRRVMRRFLKGIKEELTRRDVLDDAVPVLLADWFVATEDEAAIQRCRKVLTALQVQYEKDLREKGTKARDARGKLLNRKTELDSGKDWQLLVNVFSGHDLKAMDYGVSSDPYVILEHGSQKYRTKVIYSNLNPVWDEEFMFIVQDVSAPLKVLCFDKDVIGSDDIIGESKFDVRFVERQDLGQSQRYEVDLLDEEEAPSGRIGLICTRMSGPQMGRRASVSIAWDEHSAQLVREQKMAAAAVKAANDAEAAAATAKALRSKRKLRVLKQDFPEVTRDRAAILRRRLRVAQALREAFESPKVTEVRSFSEKEEKSHRHHNHDKDGHGHSHGHDNSQASTTSSSSMTRGLLASKIQATRSLPKEASRPLNKEAAKARLVAHKLRTLAKDFEMNLLPVVQKQAEDLQDMQWEKELDTVHKEISNTATTKYLESRGIISPPRRTDKPSAYLRQQHEMQCYRIENNAENEWGFASDGSEGAGVGGGGGRGGGGGGGGGGVSWQSDGSDVEAGFGMNNNNNNFDGQMAYGSGIPIGLPVLPAMAQSMEAVKKLHRKQAMLQELWKGSRAVAAERGVAAPSDNLRQELLMQFDTKDMAMA